jgi:hypothetical protein
MSNSALATACWLQDSVNQLSEEIPVSPCANSSLARPMPSLKPASNGRIRGINAYLLQAHPLPQTDIPGLSP